MAVTYPLPPPKKKEKKQAILDICDTIISEPKVPIKKTEVF